MMKRLLALACALCAIHLAAADAPTPAAPAKPAEPAAAAPAPFGRWLLNDAEGAVIRDAVGKRNGKLLGTPDFVEWTTGGQDKALRFKNPAKNDKLARIAIPAGDFDVTKGFSVLVTIRTPDAVPVRSRQYEIVNFTHAFGKPQGFRLLMAWGAIWLHLGDGKTLVRIDMPSTKAKLKPGTWYKVAAVCDGKTAAIWLNGAKLIEKGGCVLAKPKVRQFTVGAGADKYYGFEGILSNLVIYNAAVPEAVIQNYCQAE